MVITNFNLSSECDGESLVETIIDKSNMFASLNVPEMTRLVTSVEEATRSTKEGVLYFVEPAGGSLARVVSRRHHIIFGRRGSGKSSLLRKAAADLTVDRAPIAWVDLEPFKGHSYPDLLLSVLIATLEAFKDWLDGAAVAPANRSSFWSKLFGKTPIKPAFNRAKCAALSKSMGDHILALKQQLHAADEAELKVTTGQTDASKTDISLKTGLKVPLASADSNLAISDSQTHVSEVQEAYRRSKVEFLKRHIMEYHKLFDELSFVSGGDAFLFLDDLYHIRKDNQPQVVDYLHSIAKSHKLWLKFGTIRHRTEWYIHGNPPIGVKLGDDADEIDLDLTLEKYALAKNFLVKILSNFTKAAGLNLEEFLTPGAIDRLVLASGGVARDFLSIFRKSVDVARERGGDKISAEDINLAAGDYDTSKREEFKRDTYADEENPLDRVFQDVRTFCLEGAKSNCFLVNKDSRSKDVDQIHELVDLKLLHLIRSRVTVSTRQGKIYEAYMLDLSQYAGSRKRRGFEIIEFWTPDSKEKLRRASLIRYEE